MHPVATPTVGKSGGKPCSMASGGERLVQDSAAFGDVARDDLTEA